MSRGLDTFIYYVTAPIRLFGRSRYFRWSLAAVCVAGLFFAASLWAINSLLPPPDSGLPDALAIMKPPPPLQPVTRASHVIAPVTVSLAAIGHTLDTATPREFTAAQFADLRKHYNEEQTFGCSPRSAMSVTSIAGAIRSLMRFGVSAKWCDDQRRFP